MESKIKNIKKISQVFKEEDNFDFQLNEIMEKEEDEIYIKMEKYNNNYKKNLLEKISSKYIIDIINTYIKDENYIYKLIKYNKLIQKKLNIKLIDYKEKYYNKNIKWENWLNLNKEEFEKIKLYYNENDFNYFILKYYQNLQRLDFYKSNIRISIYSLFLSTLSKLKNFGEIFILEINLKNIGKGEIYILNKFNDNSLSLKFYYKYIDELYNIKNLNLNFTKIKKLKFNTWEKYPSNSDYTDKYYKFFNYIFSINDIINNLIYLKLEFIEGTIEKNNIEKINEFKSLKYLKLYRLKTNTLFEIKLNNLETITLYLCINITFKNNIFLNLKNLKLKGCSLVTKDQFSSLKCPNLENYLFYNTNCNIVIDFSSIINLKIYKGDINFFISLGNSPIEKVIIEKIGYFNKDINLNNFIKKICDINTLKEIEFPLDIFKDNDNILIQQKNYSINKIKIIGKEEYYNATYNFLKIFPNLINLMNIFPNLIDFYLESYYLKEKFDEKIFIKFLEKILKMKKIKKINIILKICYLEKENEFYAIDKLSKLFPEIKYNKFEEIFIKIEKPLEKKVEYENKKDKKNDEICCII